MRATHSVYGLDLISVTDNSSVQTYFLYDGLGSTTELADEEGDVTGTYTYDIFAPVRAHTGASTEWFYTGEQNDPTGLEYLRARYYDPAIGRFVSRDRFRGSAMTPLSLNPYAYVLNNPLNWIDPWGLRNVEGTPTPTPVGTPTPTPWAGYMPCGPVGPGPGCPNPTYLDPSTGKGIWGPLGNAARAYWEHTPGYLGYRAAQHVAEPVVNALTSECSRGLAKVSIGVLSIIGAATGAGAIIEAGGVVTVSVGITATSAAAVGAAAGPENIQRAVTFMPSGFVQVYGSCGR